MDPREAESSFDHPVLGESTISRALEDSVDRHGDAVAQLYKGGIAERSLVAGGVLDPAPDGEFAELSYDRLRDLVRNLAAGFRELGVDADDRVGIFASTRMEWAQCDFGLLAAGAVVTTLYPSSSSNQVSHLLSDSGAVGVVVEDGALLDRVLSVADDTDCEFVVVVDEFDATELTHDPDDSPLAVYSLATVHERGTDAFDPDRYDGWLAARNPTDLASLIYTSGTTGRPKGVRLTHGNFRANVDQCFRRFGPHPGRPSEYALDVGDRTLTFLPLSHVFERLAGHFLMFLAGATVAYAESPDTLREDFPAVRPTVGTSVPRVYEKLYAAIREGAAESALKHRLFEWAIDVGRERFETDDPGIGLRAKHAVADRLVFRTVRGAIGGEVEFFISGGGSLSAELCTLYHAMGVPVLEGYGLTETSPVVSVNPPTAPKIGTIGPPVDGVEIRIDGGIDASIEPIDGGDVGELLVRGPNVTDGYWDDPEATDRAFTGDGWFRTGDVVERRPDGYLRFRERLKEILTLSTGKNVAPVPLENSLADSPLVSQAMVLGDSRKFVSALVVPDVPAVRSWATESGIDLPADPAEICADDRVTERIGQVVAETNDRVEPHERIKQFRLLPEEFTEDNDLLTPTLKMKRRNIRDRHADVIEAMYRST